MRLLNEFKIEVRTQLIAALEKYNISDVSYNDIHVTCDIRGKCAGRAGYKTRLGERKYYLKFNTEAIEKYNEEMIKDTIPHEIAHLICYMRPELGTKHNYGWKKVCRDLGGDDARTHTMTLTPARKTTRHEYYVDGKVHLFGNKIHKKIQVGYSYSMKGTNTKIQKSDWMGANSFKDVVKQVATTSSRNAQQPKKPTTSQTKKQQAETIYNNNKDKTRQHIISMFMNQLNMTKAGASTYFYNCRNNA